LSKSAISLIWVIALPMVFMDFWIAAIALLDDLDEQIDLLSLLLSNLTEQAEAGCPFLPHL
jgi:hypothetical protein